MDVTRLDFPDASFDAAVATFVFCVLPEEQQASGAARARPRGEARRGDPPPRICPSAGRAASRDGRACGSRGWPGPTAPASTATPKSTSREAGLEIVSSRYVVPDLIKLIEISVTK